MFVRANSAMHLYGSLGPAGPDADVTAAPWPHRRWYVVCLVGVMALGIALHGPPGPDPTLSLATHGQPPATGGATPPPTSRSGPRVPSAERGGAGGPAPPTSLASAAPVNPVGHRRGGPRSWAPVGTVLGQRAKEGLQVRVLTHGNPGPPRPVQPTPPPPPGAAPAPLAAGLRQGPHWGRRRSPPEAAAHPRWLTSGRTEGLCGG